MCQSVFRAERGHPKLEAVEAKDHDPDAWIIFVREMVEHLKAPFPLDVSAATEQISKLNEIRHQFFVSADVEDYEVKLLEMGVRETLRIGDKSDSLKSRNARGFGQ